MIERENFGQFNIVLNFSNTFGIRRDFQQQEEALKKIEHRINLETVFIKP